MSEFAYFEITEDMYNNARIVCRFQPKSSLGFTNSKAD